MDLKHVDELISAKKKKTGWGPQTLLCRRWKCDCGCLVLNKGQTRLTILTNDDAECEEP